MLAVLCFLLMFLLQTSPSSAPKPATQAGADLKVSIVTVGPGGRVEERYGHNMLRIQRAGYGDISFNWGVFQFDDKFLANFVSGRLWYLMVPMRTQPELDHYISQDRQIWEQELNLTPAQRDLLLGFCQYNAEPENSGYRYDYFRDNCSTRVRDAIDRVLGGQIRKATGNVESDRTYRSESLRLMSPDPLLYTGLSFIFGTPTDVPLSEWDEMFIPMRMRDILNHVEVWDEAQGKNVPLVVRETVLHATKSRVERAKQPFWVPWYLLIGIGFGAAAVGVEGFRRQGRRWLSRLLVVLPVVWCLVTGLGACVLMYTWFLSDHAATRPNENLLQWTVLVLPLVLILPLAVRGWRWAIQWWLYLSCIAAALSILGLLLHGLPMMTQANGNMFALSVPANAGLALAAWLRWRASAAQSVSETKQPKGK
jgi:hypothetical protein